MGLYPLAIFRDRPIMFLSMGEKAGTLRNQAGPWGDAPVTGSPNFDRGPIPLSMRSINFPNSATHRFQIDYSAAMQMQAFTLEAWLTTVDQTAIHQIMSRDKSSAVAQRSWQFRMNSSGFIQFVLLSNNTGTNTVLQSNRAINDGRRHHVVVARDGVTMWIFIDGVLDKSVANSYTIAGTEPLCIGWRDTGNPQEPWDGNLSCLAAYNYVLSLAQIKRHWRVGLGLEAEPLGISV